MRYYYTLIMMEKIQNIDSIKCEYEFGATGTCHSLLVGMQNATITLEDSMMVSYKTKHIFSIQSRNPWYIPKVVENLCLHTVLYSSFLHN